MLFEYGVCVCWCLCCMVCVGLFVFIVGWRHEWCCLRLFVVFGVGWVCLVSFVCVCRVVDWVRCLCV